MSSALEVTVHSPALDGLEARIRRLALGLSDTRPLLEALGAELESQTRRRIESERTSPIGEPWPEWSDGYAKTRHANQDLLQGGGGLLDSIQSAVRPDLVETGLNLVYAAIHQFGGEPGMPPGPAAVPAREYLGIGPENEIELDAVLDKWADRILERLLS